MNVYVASSWRNKIQQNVVSVLRADGHKVYDYRHPEPGNDGFHWSEIDPAWKNWSPEKFSQGLDHPIAHHGFSLDMKALEACSACVLVLPCGRSAHLELGWAAGAGRLTIVYMPETEEPELMYRMCDYLATSLEEVRAALSKERPLPRWQRDVAAFDARSEEVGRARGNTFGSPLYPATRENPGPCRDYCHRPCRICDGCWRHGACICPSADVKS